MTDQPSGVWYWKYRLKTRGKMNARTDRREVEGALVRIGDGFACLQPWTELGDPSLDKCLQDLAGECRWPLVRRAMRCAAMDGVARAHHESLFDEMDVPLSHATLVSWGAAEVESAVAAGFTVVKLKAGRDFATEQKRFAELAAAYPALRWRLDFNETGDADSIGAWLVELPAEIRAKIDFIEDPSPYSESKWGELWKKARVPLAVDREAAPNIVSAQVTVIKPAIDEPWLLAEASLMSGKRLVVTSYMEHPFGQAFAAWEAARLPLEFPGCLGVCGLQTHHLYEEDMFTEQLGPWRPEFRAPEGTGLGFDHLLEGLAWKRVS